MFLWKAFGVFPIYCVLINFFNAILTTTLINAISLKGKRIEFKCRHEKSTRNDSENPVDWAFTPYGSNAPKQFYFNGIFYFNFSSRYEVQRNESGESDLIIDSVDLSYAGNYKCTSRTSETKGTTPWSSSADLVVLDSDPVCKVNYLNVTEEFETIESECAINYNGNATPMMKCSANDGLISINSTLITEYYNSTNNDGISIISNVSAVMTSTVTISNNSTLSCNITFASIGDNATNDYFDYSYSWNYTTNSSKDDSKGKGNSNRDLTLYIILITGACVIGSICIIICLMLLNKRLCCRQKKICKDENRRPEPDVLGYRQCYGSSITYEDIALQDEAISLPSATKPSVDGQEMKKKRVENSREAIPVYTEVKKCRKVNAESGEKKTTKFNLVDNDVYAETTQNKSFTTGADGTVYTEVNLRSDRRQIVPLPPSSHRPALSRVENYVSVDHNWKPLPVPPSFR